MLTKSLRPRLTVREGWCLGDADFRDYGLFGVDWKQDILLYRGRSMISTVGHHSGWAFPLARHSDRGEIVTSTSIRNSTGGKEVFIEGIAFSGSRSKCLWSVPARMEPVWYIHCEDRYITFFARGFTGETPGQFLVEVDCDSGGCRITPVEGQVLGSVGSWRSERLMLFVEGFSRICAVNHQGEVARLLDVETMECQWGYDFDDQQAVLVVGGHQLVKISLNEGRSDILDRCCFNPVIRPGRGNVFVQMNTANFGVLDDLGEYHEILTIEGSGWIGSRFEEEGTIVWKPTFSSDGKMVVVDLAATIIHEGKSLRFHGAAILDFERKCGWLQDGGLHSSCWVDGGGDHD